MPRTDFSPQIHGFAFANSWTLDETERDQLRAVLATAVNGALIALSPLFAPLAVLGLGRSLSGWIADGLPDSYGLCGGVAFAALDYYKSGRPLPTGSGPSDQPTRATPKGAALRAYLWQRMLQSLTTGRAGTLTLAWMGALHLLPEGWPFRGGPQWLLARSKEHLAELRGHIDAGEPWPIGLVGTTTDPFSNHQVLAYGYHDHEGGTSTIYVYDMNCPGREQTIGVDFSGVGLVASESCRGSRGPLQGFYCAAYSATQPPALD
jgi:hypothetical protein